MDDVSAVVAGQLPIAKYEAVAKFAQYFVTNLKKNQSEFDINMHLVLFFLFLLRK